MKRQPKLIQKNDIQGDTDVAAVVAACVAGKVQLNISTEKAVWATSVHQPVAK